eukprot:1445112-Rhodomonas_salina.1
MSTPGNSVIPDVLQGSNNVMMFVGDFSPQADSIIADLRFYNSELTASQVQDIYTATDFHSAGVIRPGTGGINTTLTCDTGCNVLPPRVCVQPGPTTPA